MHATPKTFYFVNKSVTSKSFSNNEPDIVTETLRHIQEHLWENRLSRRELTSAGLMMDSSSTSDLTHVLTAPNTDASSNIAPVYERTAKNYSPPKEPKLLRNITSASGSDIRVGIPLEMRTIKTFNKSRLEGEGLSLSQIPHTPADRPSNIPRSTAPCKRNGHSSEVQVWPGKTQHLRTRSRAVALRRRHFDAATNNRLLPVVEAGNRVVRSPDSGLDPFGSTASPITQQVRTCLLYFESLWISRAMAVTQSPGFQIVRKSVADELQMACIVAAMASRLENFHGYILPDGSSKYIASAVQHMRARLAQNSAVRSEDIYAIMKLYVAEAYRSNLEGALVHLNGAVAAYERLNDWKSFDLDMASTLCGTGEAFFLPQVWLKPAIFNTIADPGPARVCFSHESFWGVNAPDADDRLATMLISSFRTRYLTPEQVNLRLSVLNDMLEYNRVRQKMLQIASKDLSIPKDVACWAHLRRINLVLRLLSIDTTADLLSHCVRICLITWLAIVSDLSGFGRNLEIVASHLRDSIQGLTGSEMSTHSMLVTWMMFLGAVTGTGESDGPWFSQCLAEFLVKSGIVPVMDLAGWIIFVETVNEGFFYCRELQRGSVEEIASKLCLQSLSYSKEMVA